MEHIEDGLKALDQANEELALIEASEEWQAYTTALAEAKREYENALNALKSLSVYQEHEEAVQAVADADTALREGVVAWWESSDKSQKSVGRVGVRISTKYTVADNVAFVQALNSITHSPNLINKLVKKIEINQGSIAETATLLNIPLSVTETVSAVVKGAK